MLEGGIAEMDSLTVLQLQPHPASLALCRATVTSKRVGRSSAYFAMLLVICSQPQDELPSARRTGTLNDLLQREAHLPPIQPHQSNPTTLPTSPRRAARGGHAPLEMMTKEPRAYRCSGQWTVTVPRHAPAAPLDHHGQASAVL
uniref:Uncharacterized protein n=1 Tax=Bionectria ochroleuca TaxID=29856 RepID=A0A8H7NF05_BIOOC